MATQIQSSARITGSVKLTGVFWTPEVISSSLWLDSEDSSSLTFNGMTISQWRDKSGNNRHATQTTAAYQPYYEVNGISGKPCLNYNLDGHRLALDSNISITDNMSVFSVFRRASSGIWSIDVGGNQINNRPHGFIWGTTNFMYNGLGTGIIDDSIFAGNRLESGNFIAQTRRTSSIAQVWVNGTKVGADKTPLTTSSTLNWIGYRTVQSHNGFLGEVVIINNDITTEIRQKMEGYLAHKWNLTSSLPLDHPYKNDKPKR